MQNFNFTEGGYIPSSSFNFSVPYTMYGILLGSNNNFTSIWADGNSARAQGKMYIANGDAFTIIDLATKTVYDRYTQELRGRGNETLNTDGIVDINVA